MKRLGLAMIAVIMSVSAVLAESNAKKVSKEPFAVSVEKLSQYLQLTPAQYEEVVKINAYFIEKQNQSIRTGSKLQAKKMQEAVYGNLKLMKSTLTPEQYRKYVVLLNVTNNNNRLTGMTSVVDSFLADNE